MKKILLLLCKIILVLFFIIFIQNFLEFTRESVIFIKGYVYCKGNLDYYRSSTIPLANIALNTQKYIPPDACVESSYTPKDPFSKIGILKYYLYPIKIKDHWPNEYNNTSVLCNGHYFIDLNHSIRLPPAGSSRVDLPERARIFILGHTPFKTQTSLSFTSQDVVLGRFILFNFLVLMTGCFLFCGLLPQVKTWSLTDNCSSSFLLGFSFITLIFWLLSLAEIPINGGGVSFSLYVMLFCSYFFMRSRKGSLFSILGPGIPWGLFEGILAVLTCFLLIYFVFCIISVPIVVPDEVNIWLLKAKMFYYHHGLAFDYTRFDNNYYPVLWPLNIALQYIFIGGDYDQAAKWTSAIIFVCLIGQLKFIGHLLGFDRKAKLTAILIFLVIFQHWTFLTALPENISIALTEFSAALFILWMNNRQKDELYLVSLTLTALCLVKFEGIFIVAFLLLSYCLSGLLHKKQGQKGCGNKAMLLIPFIFYGIWFAWLDCKHVPYQIFHWQRTLSFDNVPALGNMIFNFLMQKETFSIIFASIIGSILLYIKKDWSRQEGFLLIFSICLILFAFAAGLSWPVTEYRLYYPEVLTRLFSRIMPFLILLWVSRLMVPKNSRNRLWK